MAVEPHSKASKIRFFFLFLQHLRNFDMATTFVNSRFNLWWSVFCHLGEVPKREEASAAGAKGWKTAHGLPCFVCLLS